MGFCVCSIICCALLCVHSSFAIILMGNRELVALLCLSYCCLVIVIVMWLFRTVPQVDMQCVIVVFPGHTHLLFFFLHNTSLCSSILCGVWERYLISSAYVSFLMFN